MRWRNLLIVLVLAALAFGGTFTCSTDYDCHAPTTR